MRIKAAGYTESATAKVQKNSGVPPCFVMPIFGCALPVLTRGPAFSMCSAAQCHNGGKEHKMKITYEFADGTRSEVDVDEELGTLIINSRKEEHARCEKERYHCISLDDVEYEGLEFADPDTPESLREQTELSERINKALSSLSDIQRKSLLMLANGMSSNRHLRRE